MNPKPFADRGVVVLTGEWLAVARNAALLAAEQRRRNGVPASEYGRLAEVLTTAMSMAMSANGRETVAAQPVVERWVAVDEAAAQLGLSPRQCRRLAPKLGGRLIGRQWLIPSAALPNEEDSSGLSA